MRTDISGFPYLHGRKTLTKTTSEKECSYISFRQNVFYPDTPVFVQTSVNHFDTGDQSYVHDAAASWVEQVSTKGFVACVTLTGRNDRPAYRFATIDWLAYQGAPKEGVSGVVRMVNGTWLTGTTCEMIYFPTVSFLDLASGALLGVEGALIMCIL